MAAAWPQAARAGAAGGHHALAPGRFPGGATLRSGDRGWVLAEEVPERALGGALAWAGHAGVGEVHLLAAGAAGLLARRAAAFRSPPAVWLVRGRDLEAAVPAEPALLSSDVAPEAEPFVAVLRDAGAEPVVEHGVLRGEVLGLEVARIAVDAAGARLQVGVGRHDREAQELVHADRPPAESLRAAVAAVRAVRRAGAPAHQVNMLAGERWLRAVVVARPELAGAGSLAAVPPPLPRGDLRTPAPAPAVGTDAHGRPLVVVCSTGVDLDLVPTAADVRLSCSPGARLVVVVPAGDDHPVTRALAAGLADPAEIVTVPPDWRRLAC